MESNRFEKAIEQVELERKALHIGSTDGPRQTDEIGVFIERELSHHTLLVCRTDNAI